MRELHFSTLLTVFCFMTKHKFVLALALDFLMHYISSIIACIGLQQYLLYKISYCHWNLFTLMKVRGPFEKSVDFPYYSESELCGGAVTVSFSKYLPWQAMHFLQRSTHFSKTCWRPLITWKFLASELPFHGWKSPEIAWGEIWTVWWMF
jgi:hypothetical protein